MLNFINEIHQSPPSNVVRMHFNELNISIPQSLKKCLAEDMDLLNYYPAHNHDFLKEKYAAENNISCENVAFSNGSDEAIYSLIQLLTKESDEILYGENSYYMYQKVVKMFKRQGKAIPLTGTKVHNLDLLLKSIGKHTSMIFLDVPSNPIGLLPDIVHLKEFVSKVPDHVTLVLDNAYHHFVDTKDYENMLDFVGIRKNIVVLRTTSKIGFAGLRLGFLHAHKAVIEAFDQFRPPFNVNRFAQKACLWLLSHNSYLQERRQNVLEEKVRFYHFLDFFHIPHVKSQTNFILVNFEENYARICDSLEKRNILISKLEQYQLKNCVRINICSPQTNDYLFESLRSLFLV